jgi:hypothetical protein
MFAEIKNRSIVGNKVIDWEKATNGLTGESMSLIRVFSVKTLAFMDIILGDWIV